MGERGREAGMNALQEPQGRSENDVAGGFRFERQEDARDIFGAAAALQIPVEVRRGGRSRENLSRIARPPHSASQRSSARFRNSAGLAVSAQSSGSATPASMKATASLAAACSPYLRYRD